MLKNNGFTLVEICVVIAIIGIISAIAVPSMLAWRQDAKLRDAAFNLRSDLELAKMRAIRENASVPLTFTATSYTFNFAGTASRTRQLPAGVVIDLSHNPPPPSQFGGRGIPDTSGDIKIDASNGDSIIISMSRIGRIVSN